MSGEDLLVQEKDPGCFQFVAGECGLWPIPNGWKPQVLWKKSCHEHLLWEMNFLNFDYFNELFFVKLTVLDFGFFQILSHFHFLWHFTFSHFGFSDFGFHVCLFLFGFACFG